MKNVEDKKFTLNGKTVWLVQSKPSDDNDDSCNECVFDYTHSCNECVFDYTANEGEPGACPYNAENGMLECTLGLEVQHFTDVDPGNPLTVPSSVTQSALNVQVGGEHYKNLAIQPVAYIHANNLSFLEGNVVKYITRHKTKNKAQDIRKVIHYAQLILQLEYNEMYEQEYK